MKKIFAILTLGFVCLSVHADTYETLRCRSEGRRYNECRASGDITAVHVVRQHSDAECDRGQDWGFFQNRVWVDNGCEATFGVWVEDRRSDLVTRNVHCRSEGHRYNECSTGWIEVVEASLRQQDSDAACRRNSTWGVRGNRIWVDNGCEGDFTVRGYR